MRCWLGFHLYGLMRMDRLPFSKSIILYACCERCGKREALV